MTVIRRSAEDRKGSGYADPVGNATRSARTRGRCAVRSTRERCMGSVQMLRVSRLTGRASHSMTVAQTPGWRKELRLCFAPSGQVHRMDYRFRSCSVAKSAICQVLFGEAYALPFLFRFA
jgi:hypothetical protein